MTTPDGRRNRPGPGRPYRQPFDQEAFAAAVSTVIAARGISDREAARQAGVAPSTITRTIRQGNRPDVDTLVSVADWAKLPLEAFAQRREPLPDVPDYGWVRDTYRTLAAAHEALMDVGRSLPEAAP